MDAHSLRPETIARSITSPKSYAAPATLLADFAWLRAHDPVSLYMAKMEMRILFEELLPRLGEISFAGEPTLTASNFVSGPKSLPVRFVMT